MPVVKYPAEQWSRVGHRGNSGEGVMEIITTPAPMCSTYIHTYMYLLSPVPPISCFFRV